MVLQILVAWIALGALAVLFLYCCSRVSDTLGPELTEHDAPGDRRRPAITMSSRDIALSDSRGLRPVDQIDLTAAH